MKVTAFRPGGLPSAYGSWSSGVVAEACEAGSSAFSSNSLFSSAASNSYYSSIASNSYAIGGVLAQGAAQSNWHLVAYTPTDAVWTPHDAGVGGGGITVQDEGSPLATTATTLDFVGAGVTASGAGATKTITISGAAGGDDDSENQIVAVEVFS